MKTDRREYHSRWREANRESIRERDRLWYQDNIEIARARRRKYMRGYSRRLPLRILRRAIKNGEIKRQPCEVCGKPNAQAHHEDYSKPLVVRWLCRLHHARRHSEISKRTMRSHSLR